MRPDTRTAILTVGILFCVALAAMTVVFALDAKVNPQSVILGIVGLGIDLMILLGLIGAIRNPPE